MQCSKLRLRDSCVGFQVPNRIRHIHCLPSKSFCQQHRTSVAHLRDDLAVWQTHPNQDLVRPRLVGLKCDRHFFIAEKLHIVCGEVTLLHQLSERDRFLAGVISHVQIQSFENV